MSKPDPDSIPPSGNLLDLLKDEAWRQEALAVEELLEGHLIAGVCRVGWMKTWSQLQSYSQYEQLRSLVLRGFAALVEDCNVGVGKEAALNCGKPLVMERLTQPPVHVKEKILRLIEDEPLGPKVELTPERLTTLKTIFQAVFTSEDWREIAKAAADQVHHQVIALMVA
jgi:hypothetical protein